MDSMRYTLGELTESTRPICYGVLKPGPFIAGGVPLVRVTDISENYFDDSSLHHISHELDKEFSRSKLIGGEILLSIQGTVGRVAICPERYKGANISRTIAVIEPDERVDKKFLYHKLRQMGKKGLWHTSGSTRASLNIGQIRKTEISFPPLKQQQEIAAILDNLLSTEARIKASISEMENLYDSISQEMGI